MAIFQPDQLRLALTLQTLAIPSTLILCFTSMLRERSIGEQDEKRLVRLYKQHAFALELVQLFVILMAFGLITGNTVAAFEAHTLVMGFANEDVTAFIIRSAIVRDIWLLVSALLILACVNMLDSWSLPQSMQDLTDPLFRLSRNMIGDYIKSHNNHEYQVCHEEILIATVDHHYPPIDVPETRPDVPVNDPAPSETSSEETTTPAHPIPNDHSQNPALPPPPAPPLPSPRSPLAQNPSYTKPTKASLLRSNKSNASPKRRTRSISSSTSSLNNTKAPAAKKKRSVTFCQYHEWREDGKNYTEVKAAVPYERKPVRKMVWEFERGMWDGKEIY
ncbi:hypothetical protein Q7P37_009259 [Cladosporium fusiforme]